MKALGVLGTSSSAGKSWMTTALCAWLRRQGLRVAPFKAQNMSNNGCVTADGLEMARAQAVQAEACGLLPEADMNPILLKPSGAPGAQLVLRGVAQGHFQALDYYGHFDRLWQGVQECLDSWKSRCDVLVLEGAGSPVELNLMARDLVNLRPLRYLQAPYVLVGDIDRGGIYAQLAGTWALLPEEDRARCVGAIVNKFRGDLRLFPEPQGWLAPHAPGLKILGTVPMRHDLQPEEEDGLTLEDLDRGQGVPIYWIRTPQGANLTDCQPWWMDKGVRTVWTHEAEALASARVIVLPGTKNTLADLRWLKARGLDQAILAAARRGALIIGICGGYQILGEWLSDPAGVAGDAGEEAGLGLLPTRTHFALPKILRQVRADFRGHQWDAYEIHMGRTEATRAVEPLQRTTFQGQTVAEGLCHGRVWGTYLHGWFDSPGVRQAVLDAAGIADVEVNRQSWYEARQATYRAMADHIEAHLDLDPIRRAVGL